MYYHRGLSAKEKEAMFRAEMATWKNEDVPLVEPDPIVKPISAPVPDKRGWLPPRRPKRIYTQTAEWKIDPDVITQQYLELGEPSLLLPFKVGEEIGWARTVLVNAGKKMNTFKANLKTPQGKYYGSMNIRAYWNVQSHKHDSVRDVIADMKAKVYKFLMELDEEECMATDIELFRTYLSQQYNLPHDQE